MVTTKEILEAINAKVDSVGQTIATGVADVGASVNELETKVTAALNGAVPPEVEALFDTVQSKLDNLGTSTAASLGAVANDARDGVDEGAQGTQAPGP